MPGAPGTVGAAVAVLAFWPLSTLGWGACLAAIVVVSVAGVWASDHCEPLFGCKDDGRIVIDEVAGQWITLLPLLPLRAYASLSGPGPGSEALARVSGGDVFFFLLVTGFVLFRVFDIRKPGPVRWAEQHFPGGQGVMADDLLAGVLGAMVLAIPSFAALSWALPG